MLRGVANLAGMLLVVAGALLAASGVATPVGIVTAFAGVALILGVSAFLAQGLEKALAALAASAGVPAPAYQGEDGAVFMKSLGFFDYAGQPIPRLRRQSVDVDGGTVSIVDLRVGAGKPAVIAGLLFTAPCRAAGALTLYRTGLAQRLRAKSLGGAVTTGTALDESFVIYAADVGEARSSAAALDPTAIDELFRHGKLSALAIANGRATLFVENAPAALLDPAKAREIMQLLARCAP